MQIIFTGTELDLDLNDIETSGLVQALSDQQPAYNIIEEDGTRFVLNMRQVLSLHIPAAEPDSGAPVTPPAGEPPVPVPTPEPTPVPEPAPAPTEDPVELHHQIDELTAKVADEEQQIASLTAERDDLKVQLEAATSGATPTEPAPASTPDDLAALTKAQLSQALTDAGVEHDPKVTKADLVQLATDNSVTPPTE